MAFRGGMVFEDLGDFDGARVLGGLKNWEFDGESELGFWI